MDTAVSKNERIIVNAHPAGSGSHAFALQHILHAPSGTTSGSEILYRGAFPPPSWLDVDTALLTHLAENDLDCGLVFVNLSCESLLSINESLFLAASKRNEIVFELSEVCMDAATVLRVASRVDRLTSMGMRFALDDFGSGFDGLHRMYSLKYIAYVKLDGAFVKMAMGSKPLASTLKDLIANWRVNGTVVIAEWIENEEIYEFATSIGIEHLQGWHIDDLLINSAS